MKRLALVKRFTLALIFAMIGVISWGQEPTPTPDIEGSGTENDPFVINTVEGWNTFATTSSYWASGVYVELSENWDNEDPVTTIVGDGDDDNAFSGNFNGNNRTLKVNLTGDYYIAPFYYTDGATIENLTVTGTITVTGGYAAGLIYSNDGSTTIENVTVSVNIIDTNNAGYCGGFSSYSKNFSFNNCVYNGKIEAGSNSGGFCGAADKGGTMVFENCIFAPATESSISDGFTFGTEDDDNITITDCYYTELAGTTAQGVEAYLNSVPSGHIGHYEKTIAHLGTNINIYKAVEVVIEDLDDAYPYTGSAYTITPTVKFDGSSAAIADYNGSFSPSVVQECGQYTYTVTGNNSSNYYGSVSREFYVVKENFTGEGTAESPYQIANVGDWYSLAYKVNNGNSFSGKYFLLTNDIVVSTMVGTEAHPFKGHFSGRVGETYTLRTLTFNYGTKDTPTTDEIVAPFRYTDGATIEYLKVSGAIHTNVGKEAGLIGVNTRTSSTNTTVQFVIIDLDFYCYEALWYAEGGGFAYDGRGVAFNACSYQGDISASNYHGGFCGNGDNNTSFVNCLFNPQDGTYWAENFVYNKTGNTPDNYYSTCYYTEGHNQESSSQGTLVYVGTVPSESIGKQITVLYGRAIYKPVEVVIGNMNNTYIYNGTKYVVTPTVTFDGDDAIANNYCDTIINPRVVKEIGTYTFSVTGRNAGTGHIYSGTKTQDFKVISGTSTEWNALQALLSGSDATINLTKDYTAGPQDGALTIDRTVTINLNGHTIDRNLFSEETGVNGGQVFRIGNGANVTINGSGTIKGGNNKAQNVTEHDEYSDGGGIWNMGILTLNNVTVEYNKCTKYAVGTSRTARGGGIYSGIGSQLIIVGGSINNNEAQGGGGGIYAEKNQEFSINKNGETTTCNVRSNKSQDKGGGIRVDASSKPEAVIKNCNITFNVVSLHTNLSVSYGGGIHLDGGTLNMTDCEVSNNNATRYGGGIYMVNGTINAKDCNIMYNMSYDSQNKYTGYGGGVCIMGGRFNMDGGVIYGNSSYIEEGGGVFVNTNTSLTLKGRVFVTGNWKYDNSGVDDKSTTNVFIMNKTGVITIKEGFDASSRIGVAKTNTTGWDPVFTKDLYRYHGTISNFVSDFSEEYTITRSNGEAKFGNPEPWNPDDPTDYTINDTWIINTTINTTYPITFGEDGCLIIVENGCLNTNTQGITNTDSNKIVLNGGELITSSTGVSATSIKNVLGAVSYQNWYLISTPFNNPTVTMGQTGGTNLITHDGNGNNEYELFRFNEATDATNTQGLLLYWENYRTEKYHDSDTTDNFDNLKNGRGYLYRNKNDYTAVTRGVLNVGDITYPLSYTETATQTAQTKFAGFHIIGNPYSHNIYKNDVYQASGDKPAINDAKLAVGYYRLVQGTGTNPDEWQLVSTGIGNPIRPMEGVLIQTEEANSEFTIANSTNPAVAVSNNPSKDGKSGYDNIMFEVTKGNNNDVAYAMFCDGISLNKIERRNAENPMLYIRQNDEDCAIATMNDDVRAFNLNFEAKTTGMYTLSVQPQGDYSYLHLYDKLTGKDVDLLLDNEYSFVGSTTDAADRFTIVLNPSSLADSENEIFAYQSGNEIIVNGKGELQVFDVMGRMVMSQRINGIETVNGLNNGVYIFRMEGKTQKIVVR